MKKTKKTQLFLFLLVIFLGVSLSSSGTPSGVHSSSNSSYEGAAQCGTCHAEQYARWNQTDHANMAGIYEINETGTFYWVAYPTRVMDQTSFIQRCAKCHVTGWDPDTKTWPNWNSTDPDLAGKFLNVQCEVCHGPGTDQPWGTASMILNYSSALCGQCHKQPADLQLSAHNDSLTDLLAYPYAQDFCLRCHSTQAFLGETVFLNTTGLEPIACALCHNPHSAEYEYQLRSESPTETCGQCHSGSHHPDYDLFIGSPHEEAGLECTSCHGQGTRLYHGEEEPWFNHTLWIYNTFYPYNQTEPMVCSNCHAGDSFDWAVSQLEAIQTSTPDLITNVTQLIDEANATITIANQTSGVDQTKIDEALTLIEAAETLVNYVEHEASGGFHNTHALSEATQLATEAELIATSARAEALGETVTSLEAERATLQTQISSLQTQVTSLQSQTATLQSDIDSLEAKIDDLESTVATVPYLYGGIGLAIGFIIGAAIVFAVRRRKS